MRRRRRGGLHFQRRVRASYGDPKWRAKAKAVRERDGHACQHCGASGMEGVELNVHHVAYVWGRLAWEYPDEELITLCVACHRVQTAKRRRLRASRKRRKP